MNENTFRILAASILFTGVGISSYFRRKADRESGEKISRNVDGTAMLTLIKLGGLLLWLSPLIYLINPRWLAWSKIGLPK
jgi:peptidoglycan biosynthesis protein MviN/MurJ (putative lipid II flippase)